MSLHVAVIKWPDGPGPAPAPTSYAATDHDQVNVLLMRELATLRPESLDADPEWLDNHPSPDENHPDAVADWLAHFAAYNPTPRFTLYALPDAGSALIPVT